MLPTFARLLLAAGLLLPIVACSGGSSSKSGSNGAAASLTATGSTALLPLVKQAADDYQNAHPNVSISVSGGGSRVGITQAAQKAADIGDSDIPAPREPSLVDHRVAVVSFGVVANPGVGVKNLTTAQIRGIFGGKITNWKQAGGSDQAITIVNRPDSSGTRAVFVKNVLGGKQPTPSGLTQDSSGTVATMVAQTPGAVSYLAMGYVKSGNVLALSIDGVAPTDANVESGKYPYWSYEHMFTSGKPTKAVAAFIAYVENDKQLLKQLHFIPISEMHVHA